MPVIERAHQRAWYPSGCDDSHTRPAAAETLATRADQCSRLQTAPRSRPAGLRTRGCTGCRPAELAPTTTPPRLYGRVGRAGGPRRHRREARNTRRHSAKNIPRVVVAPRRPPRAQDRHQRRAQERWATGARQGHRAKSSGSRVGVEKLRFGGPGPTDGPAGWGEGQAATRSAPRT
jgi:hypothetical protein